jgi:hypothetical protein
MSYDRKKGKKLIQYKEFDERNPIKSKSFLNLTEKDIFEKKKYF